jgi:hypothetical protein
MVHILMRILVAFIGLAAVYSSSTTVTDDNTKRFEDAAMYITEAQINEEEGELTQSLPFYRAAVRLVPDSAEYQLLLGKVEYQLGLHAQAGKRFRKALDVDKSSAVAKYYLQQMESLSGFVDEQDLPNAGTFAAIPEVSKDVIGCGEIADTCDAGPPGEGLSFAGPFVIRGFLRTMPFNFSAFQPSELQQCCGTQVVDFYPQNMLEKPNKLYNVPLAKALDFLAYPEGAYLSADTSEAGTYIQWNLNDTTWQAVLQRAGLQHDLPRFLARSLDAVFGSDDAAEVEGSRELPVVARARRRLSTLSVKERARIIHNFSYKTHWYMLLIGEAASGMFPHQDTLPVGSWQAQVAGAKRWRLCSPESPVMAAMASKKVSSLDQTADATEDSTGEGYKGVCYEATLQQGDMVYYPPNYWHQTLNLDSPTISLSGTLALHDHDGFIRSLQHECRNDEKKFGFEQAFCDLIL